MTQQEVIYNFMQSLKNTEQSGRAALDEAVQASSDFANYQEVKETFMKDLKAAKSWHRFLVEKCGIILDNADTGAISGSDAGGTEKTATTVVPSKGKARYPSGTSFTVNGLTIYGIPDKSKLTKDQQYVIRGLYSWWIRDSLKLIEESYGLTFDGANNSRLKLRFIDDANDPGLAYVYYDSDNYKAFEDRELVVNMAYFKKMKSSDRHGTTGKFNLDRTLAHELVHGLMAPNVNYFGDMPIFLAEGGTAELIHGVDDERYEQIISCVQNPEAFEKVLDSTFTDVVREAYSGGYVFMRYFAKQAAADTSFDYDTYRSTVSTGSSGGFITNYWDTVTMKGGKSEDTITNSGSKVYITAGAKADIVKIYSAKVTIDGGSGHDEINNDGALVLISGGKGNDSVENNGKKVTIDGGAGIDVINNFGASSFVSGGDGVDVLTNGVSYYETIDAVDTTIFETGTYVANDDIVVVGAGNSTLNAYYANLTGGNKSSLSGGAGDDTLTNYATQAQLFGEADNDSLLNYGLRAKIYGDAGDDIIFNGMATIEVEMPGINKDGIANVSGYGAQLYGGDGNDSIENEANNAVIYGEVGLDSISNSGSDVKIYGGADNDYVDNTGNSSFISLGAGNDAIENSAGSITALGGAGADSFYNLGTNSTLKGDSGNDEIINFGDSSYLSGGKNNDTIYSSGAAATLSGDAGKDIFYNEGVKAYVNGGASSDIIYNEGDHVTIAGGTGNDSINNNGGKHIVYQFGTGDGKDTVVGFNDGDTVQITAGKSSSKKGGDDVVVSVGKNTLTLKDAVGKTINYITAKGKTTSKTFSAKVSPLWFDYDNNFATTDNLSSLVKNKSYSVAELNYSSDLTSLTKKDNLITYSSKK